MTQQKETKAKGFTTAQAIAKAATFAQTQTKCGEDIRKVYPLEGTGRGGRWLSLLVCVEIDSAEDGAPLGELWIDIARDRNPRNTRHNLAAALRFARDF